MPSQLATKLAEGCCDRLTFRSFRKLFVTYMVVSHKIFYGEAVLRPLACAPGGKCPLRVCRRPSYAIVVTYLAGWAVMQSRRLLLLLQTDWSE